MHPRIVCGKMARKRENGNPDQMKPEQAKALGQTLKARREELGLSTHRLADLASIDQATVVRIEAGSILSPRPAKLTRIADALGLSGADVFALADYLVPSDLPGLRPYLKTKYARLLEEDIEKIEALAARLATRRGFSLTDAETD
jgi:transcriptional regulator with XRE-family HTH domain